MSETKGEAWTGPWSIYLPTADWIIQHTSRPRAAVSVSRWDATAATIEALDTVNPTWRATGKAPPEDDLRFVTAAIRALGIEVRDE